MTQTIRTAQSAELAGRARALRLIEKWEREFFTPLAVDYFRVMLSGLTPAQRATLQQAAPDAYESVMRRIGLIQEVEDG